jgi:anti-anti-sigma factor
MADPDSSLSIDGGVLTCPYDMNTVPPMELRAWCDRLLGSPQSMLTLDMSNTRHIASHHLGVIAQAWAEAVGRDKQMTVKVSEELRRVFEMSGLDQIFDLSGS